MLMNILALSVSVVAIAISTVFASRQLRTTETSNNTLVTLELLARERRSDAFLESEEYVLNRLQLEHSPDKGADALPFQARKHVARIGLYYNSLGLLLILGAIDDVLLTSTINYRTRQAWSRLAPYIMVERAIRNAAYMAYFEHLAFVVANRDSSQLHQSLKLLRFKTPETVPGQAS